ncbi:MAG: ATPase [Clostridia bacterium]|nr:ATPase [Clostridia bacterium]
MAIAKMKLITIGGPIDTLDRVLKVCGSCGVFQMDDVTKYYTSNAPYATVREDDPYATGLTLLETVVARMGGQLIPQKAPDEAPANWESYIRRIQTESQELSRQVLELGGEQERLRRDIEQFEHFRGLNVDLHTLLKSETISVRFGRLPKESFQKLQTYEGNPYVLFFPGVFDREYYWGVYFAPKKHKDEVDRVFASLYFERMHLTDLQGTPEEILTDLRTQLKQTESDLAALRARQEALWSQEQETCCRIGAWLRTRSYYFSLRQHAARYHDWYLLAGWVPLKEESRFFSLLSSIEGLELTSETPEEAHHNAPVKLQNPPVVRFFEYFVDMYGAPRYGEADPTLFMAITYTLLFGIMFGDVGHGLVLALAGFWMWHKKKMELGRVLIPCGFSATLFGFVFGSVFGFEHLMDPLYTKVLGLSHKPIEVMESVTTIVYAAVAVGFGLLLVAMFMNIVSCLRRKNYEEGLFGPNGVSGLVFYASLCIGGVCQLLLGIPLLTVPYVLLLIVLPLLLIWLREPLGKLMVRESDWMPESWGTYLLQSFFELFEALLSYFSNTLSFMRVGAFVLVHAGMMTAVFLMAEMPGNPVMYTIILTFGNLLVIVLEALLVAIQVMRLQFYELFSRYYIGDGRRFEPLSEPV